MVNIGDIKFADFWYQGNYDFEVVESRGCSGGLFCLWNKDLFTKLKSIVNPFFIVISGKWIGHTDIINFVNVYAPNIPGIRSQLWEDLLVIKNSIQGLWVFMGDFNDVRGKDDRLSAYFCEASTTKFNNFIKNAGLVEYNMGGRRFTWMSNDGLKLSKLDRFMVCKQFLNKWGSANLLALPRQYSNHNPIVLIGDHLDFGPCPFRFYNSWISIPGCREVVEKAWSRDIGHGVEDRSLLRKLKNVKEDLKNWRLQEAKREKSEVEEIKNYIDSLELKAETGCLSHGELQEWRSKKAKLMEIEARLNLDLKQKARVKWDVEGDENSHFFHAIINGNRRRSRINGIMENGHWIQDPDMIKSNALEFFANKFKKDRVRRPILSSEKFKKLSTIESSMLEADFTVEEIREAVWDCSSEKAPGPDGFTFKFLKEFWDIIQMDVSNAIKFFEKTGRISRGCNASFISLIPKIRDPMVFKDYRPISLVGSFVMPLPLYSAS